MPQVTIVYGVLLILLGLGGYFGTGGASFTALIPAVFGVLLVVAGVLARQERLLKHAMHAAAMLALVGFLATASALPAAFSYLGGGEVDNPPAVLSKSVMALLSLVFVVLCVRSFIAARRAREAGTGA